ncbi:MAG: thermonuclease family protein [Hyphomonadaceae bacterium]
MKFLARGLMAALVLGAAACGATTLAQEPELAGVASVIDGDTIVIHGTHIRLSGFDAPEHGRMCGQVNVYQRASNELDGFIAGRTVHCAPNGEMTHGRTVAICTVGGVDLGQHMVSQGWARDWPRFSHGRYAAAEASARAAHHGLWGLDCPADLWGNRNYD